MTTVNLHEKKSWWHSDLLKATNDDGTILLMFKGRPAESKFPGKPKWCGFVYEGPQGDQSEHTLSVEPEVEPQLASIPLDVWLKCRVFGGKGQKPAILVEDDAGPVMPGDTPKYESAPNKNPYVPTQKARVSFAEVCDEATTLAIGVVNRLNEAGIEVGSADAQGIWSTLFIQMSK